MNLLYVLWMSALMLDYSLLSQFHFGWVQTGCYSIDLLKNGEESIVWKGTQKAKRIHRVCWLICKYFWHKYINEYASLEATEQVSVGPAFCCSVTGFISIYLLQALFSMNMCMFLAWATIQVVHTGSLTEILNPQSVFKTLNYVTLEPKMLSG